MAAGSTEVTADCTWFDASAPGAALQGEGAEASLHQQQGQGGGQQALHQYLVPAGTPLTNMAVFISDPLQWGGAGSGAGSGGAVCQVTPLDHGQVGEVCVAGAGLAEGYVHAPLLTASRFPTVGLDCTGSARCVLWGPRDDNGGDLHASLRGLLSPGGARVFRTGDAGFINAEGEH